jgi:hypothetical protein
MTAFSRHSRDSGNPVPLLSSLHFHRSKSLDSRFRGNDEHFPEAA